MSKPRKLTIFNYITGVLDFFPSKARLVFNKLRQALTEVLILHYYELDYYIHIAINTFGYVIKEILSQFIKEAGK